MEILLFVLLVTKSSLLNIFEYLVADTVPSGGVASLRKVLGDEKVSISQPFKFLIRCTIKKHLGVFFRECLIELGEPLFSHLIRIVMIGTIRCLFIHGLRQD